MKATTARGETPHRQRHDGDMIRRNSARCWNSWNASAWHLDCSSRWQQHIPTRGGSIMTQVLGIALALLLGLGIAGAWAEEISGKIQSVDPSDRTIVLDDGSKIWVAEGVPMDNLKEGKSVKASYEERDGKKVATNVEVTE